VLRAATRDDQHRLATMASPTGIFLIDANGELTFANPRLLEMARVPEDRLLGLGFLRYIHPDDRDAIENRIAEQLVHGERVCGDARLLCGRHREVWVRIWTSGIRDDDGAISGLAGVLDDVSAERREAARPRQSQRAGSPGLLAGGGRVASTPREGAGVQVHPPLHREAPTRATSTTVDPGGCAGTVLVVDDDRAVRDVTRRVLSRAGFQVLEAADGASAVRAYADAVGRVGCVLLDLSMPGIDGAETFRQIRAVDPDARVVLTSGHCEEVAGGLFPTNGLAGFLQKPYDLASLLQMTTAVLAR